MISFSPLAPGKGPHIAELPSPPSGAKWADPATVYDRLVYRFNGTGYLKPGYSQVFVVSADGGAARQVTTGDFPNGGSVFGPNRAVWTPDGKYLLVSANRHAESEHVFMDTEVYEFSVADGAVRALTNRKGPDNAPAISPDGKMIAYTGFDDRFQGHQTTKLYLMNRDGTGPHSLTDKLDRDAQGPQWASDGSGVYFQFDEQGDTKIGFAGKDGSFKKIADHVASATSAYGGGSFSVSKTGAIAFTSGTARTFSTREAAIRPRMSLPKLVSIFVALRTKTSVPRFTLANRSSNVRLMVLERTRFPERNPTPRTTAKKVEVSRRLCARNPLIVTFHMAGPSASIVLTVVANALVR